MKGIEVFVPPLIIVALARAIDRKPRVTINVGTFSRDLSVLSTEADRIAFNQYLENQAYIRDNIAKRMTNDGVAAMKKAVQ